DDLLAVRDPALDAARVVGLPVQAALIVAQDLVVRVRAALSRQLESLADLYALDRLRPHQRERQPRIEPFLLRRVRAETRWAAARAHLDNATDRIALCACLVHAPFEAPAEHATLDVDAGLA